MTKVKFYHRQTGARAIVRCSATVHYDTKHRLPSVRQAENAMAKVGYMRRRPRHGAQKA